jgi:hypothetical protein
LRERERERERRRRRVMRGSTIEYSSLSPVLDLGQIVSSSCSSSRSSSRTGLRVGESNLCVVDRERERESE